MRTRDWKGLHKEGPFQLRSENAFVNQARKWGQGRRHLSQKEKDGTTEN